MTTITIQDVYDCTLCYTREQIETLAAGRTTCTPRELLTRVDVPIRDRVWLGCQLLARRDRDALVDFARSCAAAAADAYCAAVAYCAAADADAAAAAAADADAAADAADAAAAERNRQIEDLICRLESA